MLPLVERVVGHLERVQRISSKTVVDGDTAIDLDEFEALALKLFEDASTGTNPAAVGARWPWEQPYLKAFVEEAHWLLLDGVGAQWTAAERLQLIRAAVVRASSFLGVESDQRLPPAREHMLRSLLERIRDGVGHSKHWWGGDGQWNVARDYCSHLGLTLAPSHDRVGLAGAIMLRLQGVDRLRWLLAIETSLATSTWDSWCVDLDSVRELAKTESWSTDPHDPVGFAVSESTLWRWTLLGALEHWTDDQYGGHGFELKSLGREIFGELAKDETTPFRTTVRALLDDDRERALAPLDASEPSDIAASATLRHARMVAHEVRNALLPVQHALKKIWSSPAMQGAELAENRRRVDEGLDRLHRFVDDSVRLTPIAAEESTSFAVMEVIDEARRGCIPAPEGGIAIEARPASANPRCRGHQGRLVLAISNLLRNAVQVGGTDVRIVISVDARTSGRVIIRVQDDGPGIPPDLRESVFKNGVSHRAEGSGHGLALVRLIVESEMKGMTRLVPSADETGAVFEIELPTEENGR